MNQNIKIIYTSDVHGTLQSFNYANQKIENRGLTRLKTYINSIKSEKILIENGDILQGSPLMDYNRLNSKKNLASEVINELNYDFVNIGNHDFNYGVKYLNNYLKKANAKKICSNVKNNQGKSLFGSSIIHTTKNGIKIGIIGAVTHYIPNFEKPENIEGLVFEDAFKSIQKEVRKIKNKVNAVVVVYHGGYEADIKTGKLLVKDTGENQGYQISKIKGVNLLLTGHQHIPQVHNLKNNFSTIQTGLNNYDFGEVDLTFEKIKNNWKLKKVNSKLITNNFKEDTKILKLIESDYKKTNIWLSEKISTTKNDMSIKNAFDCRVKKHPLFQLINDVQLLKSNAEISLTSLPNNPPGFSKSISMREVQANFIYPNTLVVLEVSGKDLRSALEKNADYFKITKNKIEINEKFLIPKVEHYNYDVYDGIDYEINVSKPVGKKITKLRFKGKEISDSQIFKVVMNNYRAAGGGDYYMFKNCKIIKEYQDNLSDLIIDFLKNKPKLDLKVNNNFNVKY